MPKFPVKYRIAGDIMQIAPPGYLWNENNMERFRQPYFQDILKKSGYPVIGAIIDAYLKEGKDVVLCLLRRCQKAQ